MFSPSDARHTDRVNVEDLAHLRDALRDFAGERGLQWVLQEVDQAVAEGVLEPIQLRQTTRRGQQVYETVPQEPRSIPGRKRSEEFVSRRPMTELEQVGTLIDALRRVLVHLPPVAQAGIDILRSSEVTGTYDSLVSDVRFAPENDDPSPAISLRELGDNPSSLRVAQLLDQLYRLASS